MNYFKTHIYQFSDDGQAVTIGGHNFKTMKAEAIKHLKAKPDTIKTKQISSKKIYFKPFN